MATKYSYNLAREESLKPTKSTALISPFSIFKDVSMRLFASPSPSKTPCTKSGQEPGPKVPVLKLSYEEEEDMEEKESTDTNPPGKEKDENPYERILQEENKRLMDFIQEILPASEDPKEDFRTVCALQLENLKEEIRILEIKCKSLEECREREKEELRVKHANEIAMMRTKHQIELGKVEMENQELINEIINFQIDEIVCWRLEYEKDCEESGQVWNETEMKDSALVEAGPAGGGNVGPSAKLLEQFKGLNPVAQGIVVAGMGIATIVIGYYTWPFINWAWPRLVAFAMDTRVVAAASWVFTFTQSSEYRQLLDAWEKGEPLSPVLFKNFGPEILGQIVKLAPILFKMKRSAGIVP